MKWPRPSAGSGGVGHNNSVSQTKAAASRRVGSRPLAPWVFPVRNVGKSAPFLLVIVLAVLLIVGIVAIMDSIPLSVSKVYGYSRYLTGATPRGDVSFFPVLKEHFERSPISIERTVVGRTVIFNVESIVGKWPFVLHGITNDDAEYIIKKAGLGRLHGRLPTPGAPEAVITEPIARNLNLRIGSVLLRPDDEKNYSPQTVRVVGICDGDEWFAFSSYEYLKENHFPPVDVLMVFAPNQREQRSLDRWAEESLKGKKAVVFTYPTLEKETAETFDILFQILNLVVALLVSVITLMMGMLINIYLGQRVAEFGLLQAMGFTKRRLARRAFVEALIVVLFGWILGIAVAWCLLFLVKGTLMDPRGFYINPLDAKAYLYSLPVPIAILFAAAVTVFWRFRRFDPISVIERRIV